MGARIVVEQLGNMPPKPAGTHCCREVMSGEISGFTTFLHEFVESQEVAFEGSATEGGIYLFLEDDAMIRQGDAVFDASGIGLFTPMPGTGFCIQAKGPVRLLEMKMVLSEEDLATFEERRERFPYYMSYSDCRIYTERIKSAQAINRELASHGAIPRFALGSVESFGDADVVALHEHAMLEQYFLGLPGNDCTVTAADATVSFGEGDLLHIPLGSMHRVESKASGGMNYIWIDLFASQEGEDFLIQEHKDIEG